MKKLFLSGAMLLAAWANASAYDFMVDNIAYNINPNGYTVSVTRSDIGMSNYSHIAGDLYIPESVTYNGKTYYVTAIGEEAFCDNATLTTVGFMPNSHVETIGPKAFRESRISYCSFDAPITRIEEYAFQHSLIGDTNHYLPLPSTLKYIGQGAFSNCVNIGSVSLPNTLETIDNYAFLNSFVTEITLPNSLASIGDGAFSNTLLTKINLPSSITSIGNGAFGHTKIEELEIPTSINNLESCSPFDYMNLKKISVASGSKYTVKSGCLMDDNSKTVYLVTRYASIPENAQVIHDINSYAKTDLVLPYNVKMLYSSITPNLLNVYLLNNSRVETFIKYDIPDEISKNGTLYVPKHMVNTYKEHGTWGQYPNIIGIDTEVPESSTTTLTQNTEKHLNPDMPQFLAKALGITWESTNPDVCSVDNQGLVTAKNVGTTTVSAHWGAQSRTYTIKVLDKCDVNGDTSIDIVDVNMIIDKILNK